MGDGGRDARLNAQEQLFLGLVEQLSQPFVQLARLSELAGQADVTDVAGYLSSIRALSGASLQLVESYALSLRLHGNVTPLELEPIAVSSLLYDTAQLLDPYAKQYGVRLELEMSGHMRPVLTDRLVMQSAMTSLGQVFVRAQAETGAMTPVRLGAHLSRYGVVAGLYSESDQLGADGLRRAKALRGRARQPLQKLVSGPASGVFIADSLLETLSAHLHVARYHKLTGLAATLQPSSQLQFV